jgi:hypothetical protein
MLEPSMVPRLRSRPVRPAGDVLQQPVGQPMAMSRIRGSFCELATKEVDQGWAADRQTPDGRVLQEPWSEAESPAWLYTVRCCTEPK